MLIYVKLDKPYDRILSLEVHFTDEIDEVKRRIFHTTGIPEDQQYLCFAGKVLDGRRSLAEYNIQTESTQGAHQVLMRLHARRPNTEELFANLSICERS